MVDHRANAAIAREKLADLERQIRETRSREVREAAEKAAAEFRMVIDLAEKWAREDEENYH